MRRNYGDQSKHGGMNSYILSHEKLIRPNEKSNAFI